MHASLRARPRKLGLPAWLRGASANEFRDEGLLEIAVRYATDGGARGGETRSRAGATGMRSSTNIQARLETKITSTNGIWRAAKYMRSSAAPHPEAAQTKQCWWE